MGSSEVHLKLMRDPSRVFPSVVNPPIVRSLTIWHCKYQSLEPLVELCNVEELTIATFPDNSFRFLERLPKLRHLAVLHMPKVRDIGPLAGLRQLTTLSLSTLPSWDASKKVTTIRSLEPLTKIPHLAHLELLGICPPDKSLGLLKQCKDLQTARFSQYPPVEIHRFFDETKVADQFNPNPNFA